MTNIKQFPGNKKVALTDDLPENIKDTETYIMNEVLYCGTPTKTITDFTTGGDRNRRWAMTVALAVIPEFDKMIPGQGPTLIPKSPTKFFAADTLEELKARVIYEIDKAIEMGRLSVEDPEKFMELQRQFYAPRDPADDMN